MENTEWARLSPAGRLIARAHALQLSAQREIVFTHQTAAAILGLPVLPGAQQVDILTDARSGHLKNVKRHFTTVPAETVDIDGLVVTRPARTVIDIARSDMVAGLVAADQALRHEHCTQQELIAEAAAIPSTAAGRIRAGRAARLANPLAMSPGESYSRAVMYVHGIPQPELQFELKDPGSDNVFGYGDFWWNGVLGEFDGAMKYGVGTDLAPDELRERLMAEKNRENRIRRTGMVVVRWIWRDLVVPQRLLAILSSVGIRAGTGALWLPTDLAA